MQKYLSIINSLLCCALIAIVAGIASNSLSNHLLISTHVKTIPAKTPQITPSQNVELAFYAPILTQGLFGTGTKGALSAIVNAPAGLVTAPATAPSELLLLGTVTGSHRETFALVRHTPKQEERVFRLGEMVFDSGRLAVVTRDQAFIVINGKKVELLSPLAPPSAAPTVQSPVATQVGGTAVVNQGGNNFVIDQRALNAALDNPAQAMTDARLLPSQKDGKVEGFRASEVKPQGVFGMIGIKNGDVIKSLNDFPMDAPDKALQSFIALKGQTHLKMDIIRDGQPQTLQYDIR